MDLVLKSGDYEFRFEKDPNGGIGYSVWRQTKPSYVCLYKTVKPLNVMLKDYAAKMIDYEAAYEDVLISDGKAVAIGQVMTQLGTIFQFTDTITVHDENVFLFTRNVKVANAHEDDLGFDTRISLGVLQSEDILDYDYFLPGALYKKNEWIRQRGIFHEKDLDYYWYRDTKFTLPLFSMQNIRNGDAATFCRAKKEVRPSEYGEFMNDSITSESFDHGSLGISRPGGLTMDYVYPGTEGCDESASPYANGVYRYQFGFNKRYHPAKDGFEQNYSIYMRFGKTESYYSMFRDTWRYFYDVFDPEIADIDIKKFYQVEMQLLDEVCRDYHGVWGVPFKVVFPTGEPGIVDYEMGFIGQQPNIGYQLIRYGYETGNKETTQKGLNVIDFWVNNSLTEWGLPKTWYDPYPAGFLDQNIWLRMIADGMEGILDGYNLLKKKGVDKPDWLEYCKRVGSWFVDNADEDGCWYRAYDYIGNVVEKSRANTSNIIRFLVQLYLTTGDESYKTCALNAGNWCYYNVYKNFEYRGATCDNPDIIDNESGIYACFAFLSLYDLTGNDKWMEALIGAADYTETYTYAWSYPIVPIQKKHAFHHVNFTGMSPVTAGHGGGGDVYMGACIYIYYRIYLLTGDKHYLDFARFIEMNTRTTYDIDGKFGYGRLGLCEEGSGGYHNYNVHGIYAWLPWCTYIQVDPISRMLDTFGVHTIDEAEKLPESEKKKLNKIYSNYDK
jgi:hypothetical protein